MSVEIKSQGQINETVHLSREEMYSALIGRKSEYDGIFYFGVRTTGVFCRPICHSRNPKIGNVRFFGDSATALSAGFRPCKRCRPLDEPGAMPTWLCRVAETCLTQPHRKWTDVEIDGLGVNPKRVRRWFQANHGMTFQSYLRSHRLAEALSQLIAGRKIADVAYDSGYQSVSGFRNAFQQWFGCPAGKVNDLDEPALINRILTPLGPMVVVSDSSRIHLVEFADRPTLDHQLKTLLKYLKRGILPGESELAERTQGQLTEYFEGKRVKFDLPFHLSGTEFQMAVWKQLLSVEFGSTTTYDKIARSIGKPGAGRAVGNANGDNRLAIIVPCHRVIRTTGEPGGYAGGLCRKQWLLLHENRAD